MKKTFLTSSLFFLAIGSSAFAEGRPSPTERLGIVVNDRLAIDICGKIVIEESGIYLRDNNLPLAQNSVELLIDEVAEPQGQTKLLLTYQSEAVRLAEKNKNTVCVNGKVASDNSGNSSIILQIRDFVLADQVTTKK